LPALARHLVRFVHPHLNRKAVAQRVFKEVIESHRAHGNTQAQDFSVQSVKAFPGRAFAKHRRRQVVGFGDVAGVFADGRHRMRGVNTALHTLELQKCFWQGAHVGAVGARVKHIALQLAGAQNGPPRHVVGGQYQRALWAHGVQQAFNHGFWAALYIAQALER